MPSLVQRGTNFSVEYYDPQKQATTRLTLRTDDRGIAEKRFAEWCLSHTHPDKSSLSEVGVEGLMGRFYVEAAKDYPSKYVYKSALQYAVKYLKDVSLEEFKLRRQEAFVAQLRSEGLSDGTIGRVMGAIGTAVRRAYKYDLIPSAPHILSVTSNVRRERVLTDDEARSLLEGAGNENARRYVLLALTTGARPQAIVDLHTDQFDFSRGLLNLLPAGRQQNVKKIRPIIPMTKALAREASGWDKGPVFVVQKNQQLAGVRAIWKQLKMSLPGGITPYCIRHTVATELATQGVTDYEISHYLGHRSRMSPTTERYAHYRPDYMRQASEAMDRFWGRIQPTG